MSSAVYNVVNILSVNKTKNNAPNCKILFLQFLFAFSVYCMCGVYGGMDSSSIYKFVASFYLKALLSKPMFGFYGFDFPLLFYVHSYSKIFAQYCFIRLVLWFGAGFCVHKTGFRNY